ncbi:citrate lyase holo-[acyl-carrier protein] synthase [Inediibacterium massiliense]|uniref:citrate lyase holo-[acyl-carrier protein] synthase n=1 Tax=Inediibacterium massiliense TaxID=1658111 RepID=UPI0018FE7E11|nr:citrate lyase holo-[acyl-carrier protein] synthase [Inediibacterium massiliense]
MKEVLEDREKRYDKILQLIQQYKLSVVCGKINYPGNDKNTSKAYIAFDVLQKLLISKLNDFIVYKEILSGSDGNSILIVVNLNMEEAKKIAVSIEDNHFLGRAFDIDVYKQDGAPLDRKNIGMKGRNCMLCHEDARVCIKTKRHSTKEVLDHVDQMIEEYIQLHESLK